MLFPHLRTLVYHRICLTQIEIFRLIGIYFVLNIHSFVRKFCVLLSVLATAAPREE